MNGNGRKVSQSDRAMEYVDSPRMTHRIKLGDLLSCRIHGNYGIYSTRASVDEEDASCTCPSDYYPCKHVRALIATYQEAPNSFLNIDEVLSELKKMKKSELLDLIHDMVMTAPQVLSVLGIEGFETDDEDEDYDYDDYDEEE